MEVSSIGCPRGPDAWFHKPSSAESSADLSDAGGPCSSGLSQNEFSNHVWNRLAELHYHVTAAHENSVQRLEAGYNRQLQELAEEATGGPAQADVMFHDPETGGAPPSIKVSGRAAALCGCHLSSDVEEDRLAVPMASNGSHMPGREHLDPSAATRSSSTSNTRFAAIIQATRRASKDEDESDNLLRPPSEAWSSSRRSHSRQGTGDFPNMIGVIPNTPSENTSGKGDSHELSNKFRTAKANNFDSPSPFLTPVDSRTFGNVRAVSKQSQSTHLDHSMVAEDVDDDTVEVGTEERQNASDASASMVSSPFPQSSGGMIHGEKGAALNASEPWKAQPSIPLVSQAALGSRGLEIDFEVNPIWFSLSKSQRAGQHFRRMISSARTSFGSSRSASKTRRLSAIGARFSILSGQSSVRPLSSYSEDSDSWLPPMIIAPSSMRHLVWEFLGLLAIAGDILIVPLELFDMEFSLLFAIGMWFVRIYWTLNVLLSFSMGYLDSAGNVVLSPRAVAKHYLCTWFLLDCCLMVFDWADLVLRNSFVNGFGLLRALRLVRLARARSSTGVIAENIRSEEVLLTLGIGKMIVFISSVLHIFACLWYGLGKLQVEGRKTAGWVIAKNIEEDTFAEKYCWSLHWVLVTFSGDSVIMPTNVVERVYTCVVLFLFIVVAAALVSSITTAMTRLQMISSEQNKHFLALRRYMQSKGISRALAVKVQRNAQWVVDSHKKHESEESIVLLKHVSEPLMAELHYELHMRHLIMHPFFAHYADINPTGVRAVCHSSVYFMSYQEGDVLFFECEVSTVPATFFLLEGKFMYTKEDGCHEVVKPGTWVAEQELWTKWQHQGQLVARTDCRVMILNAESFAKGLHGFPSVHARLYASLFVSRLNEQKPVDLTDIADPDSAQLQDIVELTFDEYAETAAGDNPQSLVDMAKNRHKSRDENARVSSFFARRSKRSEHNVRNTQTRQSRGTLGTLLGDSLGVFGQGRASTACKEKTGRENEVLEH